MQYPERFVLPGSERQLPDGHVRVGDVDRDERAAVTVYVRPRAEPAEGERVSREEYAARFGAAPKDIEAVGEVAAGVGQFRSGAGRHGAFDRT